MRILISPDEISGAVQELLDRHDEVQFLMAWATVGSAPFQCLKRNRHKIRSSVVGLHFYQTHPKFIREFMDIRAIKYHPLTDGVFHPKVYLFKTSENDWDCIVGSANFTKSAFEKNNEICVHFNWKDAGAKKALVDLKNELRVFTDEATNFTEEKLAAYLSVWKRNRKRLDKLAGKFGNDESGKPIHEIKILMMNWQKFVVNVRNDSVHDFNKRINLLNEARHRFHDTPNFSKHGNQERKKIAGYIIKGEDDIDWGWFGTTRAMGYFMNRVNENDPNLGLALDCIPIIGRIEKADYMKAVKYFIKAFPGQHDRRPHSLSGLTRLLAMKRPDNFVCFNNKNSAGLNSAFGTKIDLSNYEEYWDGIIGRLKEANWWNSDKPTSKTEKNIWRGRAAFMDSLFYEG